MSRPLPVFPGFLRKAAYAYSYRPHCEQVGEPLELSHDGTGVLKDAPGGSIDLKGFPNAARDVTNKHRWAVVEFSRTADRDKTHGTEKQLECNHAYPNIVSRMLQEY
ncbi:hypothetical protein KEM54_002678 [Ascosphaera aggregata]|nr:hypothetical protein KEM54_002678 [Ascosphaera aggregata]